MNIWSKPEIVNLLARYTNLTHSQVFGSQWNQKLIDDTKSKAFEHDKVTLYRALNCYSYMFADMTGLSGDYVKIYIQQCGLIEYIEGCSDLKDQLNSCDDYHDVIIPHGHPVSYLLEKLGMCGRVYTFLNWLKRVPIHCLDFDGFCKDKFIKNQDRLQSVLRPDSATYQLIVDAMRHIINCLLYGIKPDDSSFVLPPHQYLENVGSPYSYYDKWVELGHYSNHLPESWRRFWRTNESCMPPNYNLLHIVPKNYKTGRTICIESIFNATMAYRLSEPMTKRLNRRDTDRMPYATLDCGGRKLYVPVGGCYYNYQPTNQAWACYGSLKNAKHSVATMDLSMASDSVSTRVCADVLPRHIFEYGMKYRSRYTMIPTRKGLLLEVATFMTMGNPMTYPLESVILIAACILATCWTYGHDPYAFKVSKKLLDIDWSLWYFAVISAIGDDMILASDAVPALLEILATLGFIVNEEKSYWGSVSYRESCGKEFWNGIDVTGLYYPRGTSTNEYAELIGLQHKLADFPLANAFIIQEIVGIFPAVTRSEINSKYSDIWTTGLSSDIVKTKKGRSFFRNFGSISLLSSNILETIRRGKILPKDTEIEVMSVVATALSKDGRPVSTVDAVGKLTFTFDYRVKQALDPNDSAKIATYSYTFYGQEALSLLKQIMNSSDWAHDYLVMRLSFTTFEGLRFSKQYKGAMFIDTEALVEDAKQGNYVVHTEVTSKLPKHQVADVVKAQECAYMITLAKTRSAEAEHEWYDSSAVIDYGDVVSSVLGGAKPQIQNKNDLF